VSSLHEILKKCGHCPWIVGIDRISFYINDAGDSMLDNGFEQYGQSVFAEYWICDVAEGSCSIVHFPSN